jgi:hypothetical protein
MNQRFPNSTSYTGGTEGKKASLEAAQAKTQAKRDQLKAALDSKNQFTNDARAGQMVLNKIRNWFAKKGITQEIFEDSLFKSFADLGINPNSMSSEELATLLATTDYAIQKEFTTEKTTGYESPGSLSIFLKDLQELRKLHSEGVSEDSQIEELENFRILEGRVNYQSTLLVDLIRKIESSEDGRLIIFPDKLPAFNKDFLLAGENGEWLEVAPKMQITLASGGEKICITSAE